MLCHAKRTGGGYQENGRANHAGGQGISPVAGGSPRRAQTSASVQGAPVSGVESVVLGVNNLDASIALFRKAYGWAAPLIETQKDFGKLAYFPGAPVITAHLTTD